MEEVRYSEDVKETISLAGKLARKARRNATTDRDYLQGLLLTRRKFNRLDALLNELKLPQDQLKALLVEVKEPAFTPAPSDLLRNAAKLAKTSRNGKGASDATVDVEHLMAAFCFSPDPAITNLFQQHGISPDRISQSIQQVNRKHSGRTVLFLAKELAEVIGFVLVFLILIKSFLGELRLIPSESMLPGLQVQDRLVIERVTHWWRPYQRGDILVFYPPMTELKKDPWSIFLRLTGFSGLIYRKEDNIDVAYIKRLIGLPGDTVEVRPGVGVFINGELLNEPYVNEIGNTCTFVRPDPICAPVVVPEGEYYMMGDNRNQSLDSRYWSYAQDERVIGRAVYRIWPIDRLGGLPPVPYRE